MSFSDFNPNIDKVREVQLSDLRARNRVEGAREWSTENLRILGGSDDKATEQANKSQQKKEFIHNQSQKARFDLNKSLGDIVHAPPARESNPAQIRQQAQQKKDGKLQINQKIGGILDDVASTGKGPQLPPKMSGEEFMAKDRGVATHLNSTVLKPGGDRQEVPGAPTASMGEVQSNLKLAGEGGKDGAPKTATVGTFNIEWLGQKQRTEEDYKQIAQVIKDSGASVLGVEEIADIEGLKSVMKHLPDHGYILGKSGKQMVGMIFDKNRVKYDAKSIQVLDDVTLGNPNMRPPLSVDMKVDDKYDFNFTVMHLKAGFDERAIGIREQQAQKMNEWVKNRQATNSDKDMIIVGDYNDFNNSNTLNNMDKGNPLDFATDEAGKDFYTNIRYKSVIDHVALSNSPGGASEEYVQGSLRTIDESKYPNYTRSVSDHKPVFFDIRTDKDNDVG